MTARNLAHARGAQPAARIASGFDPELNWNGTSNFSTAEFLTQPPVRYFTARVSLNW
jgi:hypothetical protein